MKPLHCRLHLFINLLFLIRRQHRDLGYSPHNQASLRTGMMDSRLELPCRCIQSSLRFKSNRRSLKVVRTAASLQPGILNKRVDSVKYMSFHYWLSSVSTLFTKINFRKKASAKLKMAFVKTKAKLCLNNRPLVFYHSIEIKAAQFFHALPFIMLCIM